MIFPFYPSFSEWSLLSLLRISILKTRNYWFSRSEKFGICLEFVCLFCCCSFNLPFFFFVSVLLFLNSFSWIFYKLFSLLLWSTSVCCREVVYGSIDFLPNSDDIVSQWVYLFAKWCLFYYKADLKVLFLYHSLIMVNMHVPDHSTGRAIAWFSLYAVLPYRVLT